MELSRPPLSLHSHGAAASRSHNRPIVSANGGGGVGNSVTKPGEGFHRFRDQGSVPVAPGAKWGPGPFVHSVHNSLKFTIGHLCNIVTTNFFSIYHIHIEAGNRGGAI